MMQIVEAYDRLLISEVGESGLVTGRVKDGIAVSVRLSDDVKDQLRRIVQRWDRLDESEYREAVEQDARDITELLKTHAAVRIDRAITPVLQTSNGPAFR